MRHALEYIGCNKQVSEAVTSSEKKKSSECAEKDKRRKNLNDHCARLGTTKQWNASFGLHVEHQKHISTKDNVFHSDSF